VFCSALHKRTATEPYQESGAGAARKALPRPAALRLSPQPCSSSEGAAACCRGRRLQRQFFRASPEACSISLEILALETWHARQRDPNTSASCSNSSELLSYRGWSSGATTLRLGERESRGISPRNFAEELPRGRSISSRCRVRVRVRVRMLSIRRRAPAPPEGRGQAVAKGTHHGVTGSCHGSHITYMVIRRELRALHCCGLRESAPEQ